MQRLGAGHQFRLEAVSAAFEHTDHGPVGAAQGDLAPEVEPPEVALSGAADDQLPAGWSLASSRRGLDRLCADCTRSNIRAIEAKLPEEYWEA